MDGQRFDDIARKFAIRTSRRGLFRSLAGAAAGLIAARVPVAFVQEVEAATPPCSGKACTADSQCCAATVCRQGACRAGCRIDGQFHTAGVKHPTNRCLQCRPNLSTTVWSPVVDGSTCDDGNPCTKNDVCKAGFCKGQPACGQCKTCDPKTGVCLPVAEPHPCDDGNLCTVLDYCSNGVCRAGSPLNCIPKPCQVPKCDPKTGQCEYTNRHDGVACSAPPIDKCHTARGTCSAGACVQSEKHCKECNVCDPAVGCVPVENGTECSDGKFCTGTEHCIDGACVTNEPYNVLCVIEAHDVCQTGCVCSESKKATIPTHLPKGTPCTPVFLPNDPPLEKPECHYNWRCGGGVKCISDYNPCDPDALGLDLCHTAVCDGTGGCVTQRIEGGPCRRTCPGADYSVCTAGCAQIFAPNPCVNIDFSVPGECPPIEVLSGNSCAAEGGPDYCGLQGVCNEGTCVSDQPPAEGHDCSDGSECCADQYCVYVQSSNPFETDHKCHSCADREGKSCLFGDTHADDYCCPTQRCVCSNESECFLGHGRCESA